MIMPQVLIERKEVWKDDVELARQEIEMLTSANTTASSAQQDM